MHSVIVVLCDSETRTLLEGRESRFSGSGDAVPEECMRSYLEREVVK